MSRSPCYKQQKRQEWKDSSNDALRRHPLDPGRYHGVRVMQRRPATLSSTRRDTRCEWGSTSSSRKPQTIAQTNFDGSPEGGARFVRSRVVASVSLATGRRGAYRSSLVPVALAIIRSQPIMITDTVMLHLPLTPDRYPKGSKPIRGLISSRSCANATERTSANYTSLNRAFAGACYSRRCLNPYPSVTPKMYGLLQITGYYSVTTTQKSAW